MIFADLWFLGFIAITVPSIWLLPEKLRRLALLTACATFHAHYAGPAGMAPIICLAAMTYFALSSSLYARLTVIAVSVLALLHYKYTAFFNGLTGFSLPTAAAPL